MFCLYPEMRNIQTWGMNYSIQKCVMGLLQSKCQSHSWKNVCNGKCASVSSRFNLGSLTKSGWTCLSDSYVLVSWRPGPRTRSQNLQGRAKSLPLLKCNQIPFEKETSSCAFWHLFPTEITSHIFSSRTSWSFLTSTTTTTWGTLPRSTTLAEREETSG